MKISKKLFLTFILLLFPVLLIASDEIVRNQQKSFIDYFLTYRYLVIFILFIIGLYLIWNNKITLKFRIPLLIISFLLFGVIGNFITEIYITPSPVCASTKIFSIGLKPQFLATLSIIGVLSLVSTKGFCGFVCPIGALQELFYRIPGLKKFKVKFLISNSIRILIFVLFLLLLFSFGFSIYLYINLFDLLHWDFNLPSLELIAFIIFIVIMLGFSVILFRPFCYFICPFGLYSWILEQVSILRVRLNKSKCNQCGLCEKQSPCPAIIDIMKEKTIKADCHLCGDCMRICNKGALYFGLKGNKN
ncbi:MAG: 4Fe-4S binding protein [Ignavibacteria bacterium]|nr:4Fe-4S binding protein [Ignavibacteria bacterium]